MENELQTTSQNTGVANFDKMEAAITEVVTAILATKFSVMTPKDMAKAKEVRAQIKALRINLGKAGKAAKSALNTEKRRIDTEVVRLTELALTGEDPLHKLIKDREDVLAEEKRIRDEADRQRKIKIQDTIARLADSSKRAQGHPSADIEKMLDAVECYEITNFFQEFIDQATAAKLMAMLELTGLLDDTRIREELAREQEAEKARLAEQKREQDERQAILDTEQARIDKEKADLEAASIPEEKQEDQPEPTGKPIQELADTVIENTLSGTTGASGLPVQDERAEWVPVVRRLKKDVLGDILATAVDSGLSDSGSLERIVAICKVNIRGKK